jgi:hypothetical protein
LGHQTNKCSKPKSHLKKNILIKKHADVMMNLIYDNLNSNEKIMYEDGCAQLVIQKSMLTLNGDSCKD